MQANVNQTSTIENDYRSRKIRELMNTKSYKKAKQNPREWTVVSGVSDVWDAYSMEYFGLVDIDHMVSGAFRIAIKIVNHKE